MLAFAKDITKTDPSHPDEVADPKLRDYMEYQRKLNHELFIYHALDHAKIYLQRNIDETGEDAGMVKDYLRQAFPSSYRFGDADLFLRMLRKMINAHNASNNWYRMTAYYNSVAYDCLERFVKIYNRLLNESPDKAENYPISKNVEVDFDDWVQIYFQDLDFLLGQEPAYTHYIFMQRNRSIEKEVRREVQSGKSRADALNKLKDQYQIDPLSIRASLGEAPGEKDLELFYTSTENPIYEYLYASEETGLNNEETLIDHSYFLGFQLRGLDEQEAEKVFQEIHQIQKK